MVSLKYSEAICIIQEGCIPNGIKIEIGWVKRQIFFWKQFMLVCNCNLYYMLLLIY
jgi:hypothetical protein